MLHDLWMTPHLHPVDDVLDVSQQVLGQHQPQPGLALDRLVHVDVNVHRAVALQQQLQSEGRSTLTGYRKLSGSWSLPRCWS